MNNNGVFVDNYSINVPLFDGTVYIHMRKNNNIWRRRPHYRNRHLRGRNYQHRGGGSHLRGRNYQHRGGGSGYKNENESFSNSSHHSRQLVNPLSVENLRKSNDSKVVIRELKPLEPVVLVHGGAGDIPDSNVEAKVSGVKLAARLGYQLLCQSGGNVVDAVEAAVLSMEKDPAFNAGYGSVLNRDGEVEMEASIQRGSDQAAGAVTLIKDFPHPISIARRVMEQTPHTLLGGEGARMFALKQGFKPVDPTSLITQTAVDALTRFVEKGGDGGSELCGVGVAQSERGDTVGAVAIDGEGRIAVATSTGGRTGKYVGRIGDTPQIGSGTFAQDEWGGVSTTGHGDSILRSCLAHEIVKRIEAGETAQVATTTAIDNMTAKMKHEAGAVSISHRGDVGVYFSSRRMAWCYVKGEQMCHGINKDEFYVEELPVKEEVEQQQEQEEGGE